VLQCGARVLWGGGVEGMEGFVKICEVGDGLKIQFWYGV